MSSGNPPEAPQDVSEDEVEEETSWQEEIKIKEKTLELKVKTEDGKEKTLRLRFEK